LFQFEKKIRFKNFKILKKGKHSRKEKNKKIAKESKEKENWILGKVNTTAWVCVAHRGRQVGGEDHPARTALAKTVQGVGLSVAPILHLKRAGFICTRALTRLGPITHNSFSFSIFSVF
jgi:hypothetical protein